MTLLELINKALLSVGEREVPSSTASSVARLVKNIIEEALVELQYEHTWNFRKTRVDANDATKVTANGNDYTISDLYDLTAVRYDEFDMTYVPPDTRYFGGLGYTVLEDKTIRLFSDHDIDSLTFVYVRTITLPALDTDEVDLPEEFATLILKKVRAMLYLQHLDDLGTYQQALREYDATKRQLQAMDYHAPGRAASLYRGRRRRNQAFGGYRRGGNY